MKAAIIRRRGIIEITDRPVPEPPPGCARIATAVVGICGSDLHLLNGRLAESAGLQPGHEVAGTIDAVGDGVDLSVGTRVVLEPIHGCSTCFQCRTGRHNLCESSRIFGVTAPGGMAEFLSVPAQCLHVLPPEVDFELAALAEPLAVAVRAARLGGVGPRDRVVVLGAGTVGLMSVLAARTAGAREILVTARYPRQAELALSLGAETTFADAAALIKAGSGAADVVIETVGGQAETISESVATARRGGKIVMLGVFHGAPALPARAFMQKELTLLGSNCYGRERVVGDFALATRLLVGHRWELRPMVTHRFKLDQIAQAYATAADKTAGAIKVQMCP